MATDDAEDDRMEDAPLQRDDEQTEEGGSDSESSSESENEPVLAVTRERRANAGNRMSKLLELAELEDAQQEEEYGEIFKEAADDVEFEAQDDEEGDVNMDSSSEDEDAEAAQDEEAGEKELQKQERSENKKKRKRESLLQDAMKRAAARVGPKVAPLHAATASSPTSEASSTRPRKKSERVSWLPEAGDGALRASSRQLAVQNKTAVHERLKEKEKHRLRTVAIMKAAERRKEADRPKTLTQEERLEEAARVERMNSKSLNRWEAAERKRIEEQKARLAALKNHRLEGPIITYYSGPALWVNDKLKVVGKDAFVQEVKGKATTPDADEDDDEHTPAPAVQPASQGASQTPDQPLTLSTPRPSTPLTSAAAHTYPIPKPPLLKEENHISSLLQGIEEYAHGSPDTSHAGPASATQPQTPQSQPDSHQPPADGTPSQHQPATVPYETPSSTIPLAATVPAPAEHTGDSLLAQFQTTFSVAPQQPPSTPAPAPALAPPAPLQPKLPPRREIASRILVTLRDFPEEIATFHKREPDFFRHHLLDWPLTVAQTKKEHKATTTVAAKKAVCAVTGQPARYCDPATGLYYIDAVALKGMRWVVNSKGKWNELTGTFAHSDKTKPARGVPDMFLMNGEELRKRREGLQKVRAEQEKARAEARAKAQAEAQARAQAQAQAQAQNHAQHQTQGQMPRPGPVQGGQQSVYQAQTYPQVQMQSQPRPPPPPAPPAPPGQAAKTSAPS